MIPVCVCRVREIVVVFVCVTSVPHSIIWGATGYMGSDRLENAGGGGGTGTRLWRMGGG